MNYRKFDIVEIEHDGKLVTAQIQSFNKNCVNVIIHNTPRVQSSRSSNRYFWRSSYYPTVSVKLEDIKRVIKRKRGKSYKKKYDIILIDENGNIINND